MAQYTVQANGNGTYSIVDPNGKVMPNEDATRLNWAAARARELNAQQEGQPNAHEAAAVQNREETAPKSPTTAAPARNPPAASKP